MDTLSTQPATSNTPFKAVIMSGLYMEIYPDL